MHISHLDATSALCALLLIACVVVGVSSLVAPRELLALWWPPELLASVPAAALSGRAHTSASIALVGALALAFVLWAGLKRG